VFCLKVPTEVRAHGTGLSGVFPACLVDAKFSNYEHRLIQNADPHWYSPIIVACHQAITKP
jgi:hypothetical protein